MRLRSEVKKYKWDGEEVYKVDSEEKMERENIFLTPVAVFLSQASLEIHTVGPKSEWLTENIGSQSQRATSDVFYRVFNGSRQEDIVRPNARVFSVAAYMS